jgi:hypothetical protein
MTARTRPFSAGAGEHLVLGELLKRGVEAYLAHGKSQPGWDIAVVNPGGVPLRVQVKAIDWPAYCAVNGTLDSGFDILVIVLLNGEARSRFLIIPIGELQQYLSQKNEARRGGKRTLTVGKNFHAHSAKNLKQYEDKWSYVTGMVVPGPPAQLDEE